MKTLLTIINRNKNHESHRVLPYSNKSSIQDHSTYIVTTHKKCDAGTFLIYVFGFFACNCIFCPVCFLIWSPLFYFINLAKNPSPTNSPTSFPTQLLNYPPLPPNSTIYNYTY